MCWIKGNKWLVFTSGYCKSALVLLGEVVGAFNSLALFPEAHKIDPSLSGQG
jgi:hypothetical protein